jgi:GGDEF domain-containing protein
MMAVGEGAPIEDPATGLFSEAFLRAVLPTRIATARRSLKQLGLVLVQVDAAEPSEADIESDAKADADVDEGRHLHEAGTTPRPSNEAGPSDVDLGALGLAVHRALRDSDIAAGLDDDRFAMLLEFTPVEGCVVVAQRFIDLIDKEQPSLVAVAGVACYPAHAIDASELFAASTRALEDAKSRGPRTIVVAPVAD